VSTNDARGLDRQLAQLQSRVPDEARASAVRARAHAMLAARRDALARSRDRAAFAKRMLAPIAVGGFCLLYVTFLIWDVLKS